MSSYLQRLNNFNNIDNNYNQNDNNNYNQNDYNNQYNYNNPETYNNLNNYQNLNNNYEFQNNYTQNYQTNNENPNINDNCIFNHYGIINIGKVAKINEDYLNGVYLLNNKVLCMGIADGMGSVLGGQISSVIAIDEILNYLNLFLKNDDIDSMKYALKMGIYMVNRIICNYSFLNPELYNSFFSTLTIALINTKKEMVIGHIGNTRLYILRNNEMVLLTRDDTEGRDLVDNNEITESMYKKHPRRNILTKYLGLNDMEPFIENYQLETNDFIILMTNGVFDLMSEEEIRDLIFEKQNSQEFCEGIIDTCNELGGIDNIGIMISFIDF